VVDVGTGTAVLPIRLAALPIFERAYFIGTDLFADMVNTARTAVGAAGLANRIRIEECDVHSMPFDDNSVDYIISRSTIHHWADPVQAFREIYRVLKGGGKAILHDPRRDPNPEYLEQFNAKRRAAGFEPNDLSEKYTADEVTGFLNAAGIGEYAKVRAPKEGPASMGYEVLLVKPANL
jgi:ubiquinone/menaquinone biosynthesis C-methylase UbiE